MSNTHSPKSKPPVQPPTVGVKVPPNVVQVQASSHEQVLISAKMRLFELPPDSQNDIAANMPDEILTPNSETLSDVSDLIIEKH